MSRSRLAPGEEGGQPIGLLTTSGLLSRCGTPLPFAVELMSLSVPGREAAAIVSMIRPAIRYGSPCEFGRRSSR